MLSTHNDERKKDSMRNYSEALEYLSKGRNKANRPAESGNSRRIVRDFVAPNTASVVYHQTPVVSYHADGRTVLYGGGWATKTTMEVMESYATRIGGLSIKVRNNDKHGRGDGFLIFGREAEWPRTPADVRKCRGCYGSGVTARGWSKGSECYGCKGTGSRDYGSQLIPLEMEASDALTIMPDGTMTVRESPANVPTYSCKCTMCLGGYSSWQEAHYAAAWDKPAQISTFATAGYVAAVTSTVESTGYAYAGKALTSVLPGLDTRTVCPVKDCEDSSTVYATVMHLNDDHGWTRQAVADWLDTLDADLTFPIPTGIGETTAGRTTA